MAKSVSKSARATGPGKAVVFLSLLILTLLLAGLNVYEEEFALDLSLVPRLFGLLAVLAGAVALLALSRAASKLDPAPLRNPVTVCYGAFSAVCFGTLPFALNASAGFTDSFKAFGCLVFLGLLCAWLPALPDWRERLLQAVVCGAAVSAGLGWYEFATRLGFTLPSREVVSVSVLGGMSNVNLYAGFLALALPFCLCAVFLLRGWWRGISMLVALAVLAMLVVLQTRSAYLGVAGGALVAWLLAVGFAPKLGIAPRLRWALAAGGILAAAGVAAFIVFAPETNPVAARLRSFFAGGADTAFGARLMAWKITLQMMADHFPWGVGTGNFTVRLDEYFNKGTDFRGEGTNWIHPHNDYLAVLVDLGLPGILAFAGIFLFAAWNCLRVLLRGSSRVDAWLAVGVLAALTAYLLDSAFNFPLARVNHQVYLAAYLAVSVLLVSNPRTEAPSRKQLAATRWVLWAVLGGLILGIVYSRAAIRQEFNVLLAMESANLGKWNASLIFSRRASTPWKTLDPLATPTAWHEAKALSNLGLADEILPALERAYAHNPNRIHIINDLGSEYAIAGRYDEAIKLLSKTVERYPNQVDSAENLAQCYMDAGRPAEAVAALERIPEEKRTVSINSKLDLARHVLNNLPGGTAKEPDGSEGP
jgi:O-antigen ligase